MPSNPILALAERALQEPFSSERLTQEVKSPLAQGIRGQDIAEALQTVLTPACPTPMVEIVALICLSIVSAAGDDALVGRIHWAVAKVLDKRHDRLSLALAVQHYQQARQRFDPQSPDYGRAQVGEGNARQGLAGLGVERVKNLQEAVELYKRAAKQFAIGSPDWGTARCNQAHALRQLGKLEEAYQRLKEGLQVVENMRAQMWREQDRVAFLERMAEQYAEMVGVCLDLASTAASPEQAEKWWWEAWHWGHRGKSRALLELLANARPRLTEADRPLWEELEKIAQELDACERELRWLQRQLSGDGEPTRALQRSEVLRQLSELTPRWEQARQAYEQKSQEVMPRVEGVRALRTVDVPLPKEVVQHLRALAGTDRNPSCKPLLEVKIEFAARVRSHAA